MKSSWNQVIPNFIHKPAFQEADASHNYQLLGQVFISASVSESERLRGDAGLSMRRLVHGLLPMISLLTIIHLHRAIRQQLSALIYRAKQLWGAIHHHVSLHATLVCFSVHDWLNDSGLYWNNKVRVAFDLDVSWCYCINGDKAELLELKSF